MGVNVQPARIWKEALATFLLKVVAYGKSTICYWPLIELRTSRLSDALPLCPIASRILAFIVKVSSTVKHTVFLQLYKGEALTVFL
jgi:hypothetical protein